MPKSATVRKAGKKPGPTPGGNAMREEFARWLIDPHREGSQRDWAEARGIRPETLSVWRKHPDVRAVLANWRADLEPEIGVGVANLVRLSQSPRAGDAVPAMRLVVDVFGIAAPKKLEHEVIERVAYVLPGALARHSERLEADGELAGQAGQE